VAPFTFESSPCRSYGGIHVYRVRFRDFGDDLLGRGIQGVEVAAGSRWNPFAMDQEIVVTGNGRGGHRDSIYAFQFIY
jgi:hypothetical protein